MSDDELKRANSTAAEARDFFLASIRRRRANPDDDFISDLIIANDQDEEPLSDEQIAINAFLLYFAGHDTQPSQFSLLLAQIRRASCRARVCPYVYIAVVAGYYN